MDPSYYMFFKRRRPGEHIRLLYPLYTAINPSFPIAIHYVSPAMAPIQYTRDLTCRSFIAAAFDEEKMLLNETIKEVDHKGSCFLFSGVI